MATNKPKAVILADPPQGICNLVWVNHHEIATATDSNGDSKNAGIWIYNSISNEWRLHIKYPNDFKTKDQDICYDSITNTLWLYGETPNMVKINMKTKEFVIIQHDRKYVGTWPKLLFIDNKLHVIGGSDNTDHLVWNEDKKQFETIFTFPEWSNGNYGHGVVYVKSKRLLYVFGGLDYGSFTFFHEFWRCEIDDNYKWTKLQTKVDGGIYQNAYILTHDERYIALIRSESIRLFDTNDEKLREVGISSKTFDPLSTISMGIVGRDEKDEGMISGYAKLFNIMIPIELIDLIGQYFGSNMVYLADVGHNKLCKISLDFITNGGKNAVHSS